MVKKRYYGNECFGLPRDRMKVYQMNAFTTTNLIWVGSLGVRFMVWEIGEIAQSLQIVRIILKI